MLCGSRRCARPSGPPGPPGSCSAHVLVPAPRCSHTRAPRQGLRTPSGCRSLCRLPTSPWQMRSAKPLSQSRALPSAEQPPRPLHSRHPPVRWYRLDVSGEAGLFPRSTRTCSLTALLPLPTSVDLLPHVGPHIPPNSSETCRAAGCAARPSLLVLVPPARMDPRGV